MRRRGCPVLDLRGWWRMTADAFAVLVAAFGGPAVALLAAGCVIRERWRYRRRDLSQRIADRPDENTEDLTDARRQIAHGYRPDGSHDHDDELEPGLRLCEIDRLNRLWADSAIPEETT